MKTYILIFLSLLLSANIFPQTDETTLISDGWEFRKAGDKEWFPARVPGTVHTDLFSNGKIPDPYFGTNEKELQWIENEDWEYRTCFNVPKSLFERRNIEIIFEGLDTYARVILNGTEIIDADNMFRTWRADVKEILKQEGNELLVLFTSPIKMEEIKSKGRLKLPGGNRVYTRKAAYHYGWDWAPRFVTSGIWRNVMLKGWDFFTYENVYILTKEITKDSAMMTAVLEVRSEGYSDFLTHVTPLSTGERLVYASDKLFAGMNTLAIDFTVRNPELWWTNGLGTPRLYEFFIESTDNRERWKSTKVKAGIRTVELITEKDKYGESFYFLLNGIPVFMKGANYIPADCFLPSVSKEKYKQLIDRARNSHINMLRVWGGGIYEDDEFYNLCDEAGILVWQDFMFACAMYPHDGKFLENIKNEAVDNIKRLNRHPCIALWCGNNEIDEGWNNWGWQKEFGYSGSDSSDIWNGYIKIFRRLLPSVLEEFSSNLNYIHTSPKHGWGRPQSLKEGDMHYWGVWWGMKPFEAYREKVPRFMSEFGFQSFPDMETIESFTNPDDRYLYSDAMKNHQKHPVGFETINEYMKREYDTVSTLEEYITLSQLIQKLGMAEAIEAHRRAKPYCMGSLYWQFNDCWPVVSWSGTDYYGREKLFGRSLGYLFADILVSAVEEEGILYVYIVSDRTEEAKGNLAVRLRGGENITLKAADRNVIIPPNSSAVYFEVPVKEFLKNHKRGEVFLLSEFTDTEGNNYSNTYIFVKQKELLYK